MATKAAIHDSYWLHHTAPGRRFEALTGNHHSDVAIIGGGITGLSVALELLERGKSVAVYEASMIGTGTTSGSTGHLYAHPERGTSQLLKQLGIERARQYVALRQRAIDVIEQRATSECDVVRIPAYQYSENADDERELRHEFESALTMGLEVVWQEDFELPHMQTGYAVKSMGRMNSYAYLLHLAQLVTQKGGKIFERSKAAFVAETHPHTLRAGEGTASFEQLVCAVHSNYTNSIRVDLQIPPYQSYALVAHVSNPIPDALMWDNAEPYFYTRRVDSNDARKILVGGCDHRTGTGDPMEAMESLERYVRDRYQVQSIAHRWSAELFEPTDGLPLIGRVPGMKNVWIATGLSGIGLTQGTAAGWLIAEQILGHRVTLQDELSPSRFGLRNMGKAIVEQVQVVPDYAERVLPSQTVDPLSLKPGQGTVGNVDGNHVAVCRDESGRIHQRSPICQHMGGVVRWNPLEKTWDCPVHGGRYVACGARLYGPPEDGLERVPSSVPAENNPVNQ